MKLEEAIELMQKDIDNPGSVDILDLYKAEGLGIEALKRIQKERLLGNIHPNDSLKGETKE